MLRRSDSVAVGQAVLALALAAWAGCASPRPPEAPAPSVPTPPSAPPLPDASALAWPVQGRILSGFGAPRGRRQHDGIDIEAPRGTPVHAAAAGRVVESRWRRGYGNLVTLEHGDGVRTRYAHLAEVFVRSGARVVRGEPIATVGSTGNATTPHLHFEVHRDRRPRDPVAWLPAGAGAGVSYPASLP